ncbi:hypothetical protein JMJ55_07080 [Belnapia sp. T6]|uniref:MetA-pathway of phenol degradation n=1 Tax=Belnapia mucosa TaxID=2804532 RepID=A0ABS1V045_9PROT|nr:hypothetical protein [Belnapia mucosa]MBL6455081.1 hypothetical protein [Belnapia mucosa]
MRRLLQAMILLALATPAGAAGFDEFQIFDGRIAEQGLPDLNLHLNAGRRGRLGDNDAPRNGILATAEIGYATAPWHEVALLLPVAREFSGDLYGGGFKVRNTFISPGAADRPFAYGGDIEIRHQSTRFSETDWAMTLRPIIDLRSGPWQLILNPAVEIPIGRGGPLFTPAARVVRQVAPTVWLGIEHYMDFGRFSRPDAPHGQAHQLFLTTDVKLTERYALHLGVGHGLTHAGDRWAGKMILSVDF